MKQTVQIIGIIVILSLASCQSKSSSGVFDSDKLRGRYKVDLAPIIVEAVKDTKKEDEHWSTSMAKSMAALAFSSLDMEISFYENNKGVVSLDGGLIDFIGAMDDDPIDKNDEFQYKIEEDSVLFIQDDKTKDYERFGVIRKFSDNYDFIQIISDKKKNNKAKEITLKKIDG